MVSPSRIDGNDVGLRGRGRAGVLAVASFLALMGLAASPVAGPAQAQEPVSVEVIMGEFFFNPNILRVDPGDNVTVRLSNDGGAVHTFTIFAEVNASVPLNDNDLLQDYFTEHPTLLHVRLEPEEEVTIQFDAPDVAGNYVLVCMVPGHAEQGMHGLLVNGAFGGDGDGPRLPNLNIVQALLLIALVGTLVFAVLYHVRTTRGS